MYINGVGVKYHSMNMNHLECKVCTERAQAILDCLRNCNSGADIHKVNSMRHIAQSLIELCGDCYTLHYADLEPILKRLEKSCTEYFKDKYSNLIRKD